MNAFHESGPDVSHSTSPPHPRWPRVIGTIGIILGVVIFLDQIDDLWMQLTWTEEDWRLILSPEMAALMAAALRPTGWPLASTVIQMGFGVLLVVGSLGLRRRRRSGVSLCRLWAWLAIAWAVADIGWAAWLLSRYSGDIPGVSLVSWQSAAALGIGFALVLLLSYPVFLLVWLARPEVKAEYSSWLE
jgi:hypothetical protein